MCVFEGRVTPNSRRSLPPNRHYVTLQQQKQDEVEYIDVWREGFCSQRSVVANIV